MGTLRLGSSVVVPSVTVNTSTPPVIQSLSVTPSTSSQTITAPSGVDGYSPISVSAVDNTIDSNITANNIKSGVTILGVTGDVVELDGEQISITPTTSQQIITPTSPKNGIIQATVSAVTSSIDNNIQAGNIKSGVSILGVSGTVTELNGETQSVSLTSAAGDTFTPTAGKNAITSITVTPTNENRTVNPSTSSQSLTVNSGYSGNGTITVNPVTSSIDANITAGNIKKDVSILGVTGTYEGSGSTLITKTITQNGTYNASSDNADGYSQVTVNVSGGSRLPDGYTELEYVTFNGTQIVDTGIYISQDDEIQSKFYGTVNQCWVYGTGTTNPRITCYLASSGNQRWGYAAKDNTGITYNEMNTVIQNKTAFTINGTSYAYPAGSSFTTANTLTIGNSNGSTGTPYFNGDFYWFKVYQNNTLTANYVPAKRIFDSAVGFYDLVTNSFITPSTGTLEAGIEINPTFYRVFSKDVYHRLTPSLIQKLDLTHVASLNSNTGYDTFTNMFRGCTFGDEAFSNGYYLNEIRNDHYQGIGLCSSMFENCPNITAPGLSNLTSIYGMQSCANMFANCHSLWYLDFAYSITTIDGESACSYMFYECYNLTGDIEFTYLSTINGAYAMSYMFANTGISSLSFPALTSNSFGYYTTQFDNMLDGCYDVTVHFPAALESTLENWSSIQDGFGGTNTTVLFDL